MLSHTGKQEVSEYESSLSDTAVRRGERGSGGSEPAMLLLSLCVDH